MPIGKSAPYGSWPSPITTDVIVTDAVRLSQIALDGDNIFWIEMRPSEGGRYVAVRWQNGEAQDITPREFNVRSRVHEYGGGAMAARDGRVYFSNDADRRVYALADGQKHACLSPPGSYRFADFAVDTIRQRLICVLEDHTNADAEPENKLVSLDAEVASEIQVLAAGNDFYASPALSPDGKQLAWLTWNHPNMPWTGTELWLASLDQNGAVSKSQKIAGGASESIFQPQWSPDGALYFVSDRTGWWNLYRWQDNQAEPVWPREAEFGLPQWVFGMSTYGFAADNRLVCSFFENGTSKLAVLNTRTGAPDFIELPFTHIDQVRANGDHAVFIAGSPISAEAVVRLNLETREFDILKRSTELDFESTYLSRPETIEFPTENGLTAYAYYYPPQNLEMVGPEDELPPLIVKSHGGPTAATSTALELRIQFWTSRGFAVLDVNYGGSTGYGRAYRERLDGKWGIVDVDDCVNAAKYLVEKGLADADRVAIAGGSAGGYTTLCALTFKNFFKAGASYYGICDMEALARETHKFESKYMERLIGPYPERKDIYEQRSPIHFTEQLSCPLIIMQGSEDEVVPPNQALMMVEAVRKKGLPVAYVLFEGEQHGFRKSESIKRALEAELYFYTRIFRFEAADALEPVQIDNLKEA